MDGWMEVGSRFFFVILETESLEAAGVPVGATQ